jgi:hypothetical protein
MKHIRRLSVALLTFVLGVALSPMHFYVESIACGSHSSGTSFRSTYFIRVSRGYQKFDSPEKADEAFNKKLSGAVEVFEVGPQLDKDGTVVGRRAVIMYYFPEESRYFTRVFWTNGRYLWSISSGSAQHVREFEKRMLAEE